MQQENINYLRAWDDISININNKCYLSDMKSQVLREAALKTKDALLAKNPNHFRDHNRKIRDILLAKNPNHFRDLREKRFNKA